MKLFIMALVALLATQTHAKAGKVEPLHGLVFVDKDGEATLVRDGQNAAIVVTDEAALHLNKLMGIRDENAPIRCVQNICVIGQFDRQGKVSALAGKFADGSIEKMMEAYEHPKSYSDLDGFGYTKGKAYSMASQCQDEKRRQIPEIELVLQDRVAETLYNFLQVPNNRAERGSSKGKMAADDLIFCEKMQQTAFADHDPSGRTNPNGPISHTEYTCWLKFSKTGQLAKRGQCNIYGGSFSAGGGGG